MMNRQVKTQAWISEIEVYDQKGGHVLALQCQTPDLKPFELTLIFNPQSPRNSTRGHNWWLIQKMLGDGFAADFESVHFDAKALAAKVRNTFHWFRLDVDGKSIWLRDVRPCEPFSLHDETAAILALEELFHVR
jgi:hypothetical protein